MPLVENVANEAATALSGALTSAATTLTVATSTGFPTAPFRVRMSGTLTGGGAGVEYATVTAVTGTTWTVTRGTEPPYGAGLGFTSGATVEHVLTAGGLYATGPHVNVRAYGAKGDGTTDDGAAINAAITAAAALGVAGGATVYLPPGQYRTSTTIAGRDNVRILGAGREATQIVRTADVVLMSWYGAATSTHTWYGALEHLSLDGGDFASTALDLVYVSQFNLYSVFIHSVSGIGVDLVEVWDSNFTNLFVQFAGAVATVDKPAIYIRTARAASGFGSSTDSSNQISFHNLHLEHFRSGAIKIGPGQSGVNAPSGVYLRKVKMESPYLSNSSPCLWLVDGAQIFVECVYIYVATLLDGTPAPAIRSDSWSQVAIRDVFVANAATNTLDTAVTVNAGGDGHTVLDHIYGNWGTAPNTAHVLVNGAGGLNITNLRSNAGTLLSGWEMQGAIRGQRLTANTTTTATTIGDSPLMFQAVQPGEYVFEVGGAHQSSSTSQGPRFAAGGTAAVTAVGGAVTMWTSTTASTTTQMTAANTLAGTTPATASTSFRLDLRVSFTVTAAGSVGLRWAESGVSTGTLVSGTWARLTRIK